MLSPEPDRPAQESELENKRHPKSKKKATKKRRSSIRFSETEVMHEIPHREDSANKTYSGSDNAGSPEKTQNSEQEDSPFEHNYEVCIFFL